MAGSFSLIKTLDEGARGDQGTESLPTGLPTGWSQLWHDPDPVPLEWSRIVHGTRALAEGLPCRHEHRATFAPLVGSGELRDQPVHRWFSYKEGFSPRLLGAVLDALELGDQITVIDAFGGVGTTALAAQAERRVTEVRGVEYSPFARFAGEVKLAWHRIDPGRMRELLPVALDYVLRDDLPVPDLAAFRNSKIFHHGVLRGLLSAREHVRALPEVSEVERGLLLLGVAGVVEDLSGAMKDGRALRLKGDRKRRPSSLAGTPNTLRPRGKVRQALAGQWSAMVDDLEALADARERAGQTIVHHLPGDARRLVDVKLGRDPAFPDGWARLGLFSPPYLNCLDYTELYKLELWLMEHITSQSEFKQTRLGTLRSHPSVRFEPRGYFDAESGKDIDLVKATSDWVTAHGARREIGPVIREYFEDMLQVWREQHRVLAEDGVAVCVVANSTFSRREKLGAERPVPWRLPLLTDVLLGHLARRAGFARVEVWPARDLRPRNARAASARESLVVAWKEPKQIFGVA